MCLLMSLSERNPPSHTLIALICKDKFFVQRLGHDLPTRATAPRYAWLVGDASRHDMPSWEPSDPP
jgi:hypothetical protein